MKIVSNKRQVEIAPIEENLNGELSEEICYECKFCSKWIASNPFSRNLCEGLSDTYYCSFCLRHGFHTKNNKNILPITFRSVFAHYYYEFYKTTSLYNPRKMYLSEINDYVKSHIETGLLNPLFVYDSETFIWFVDFSRIGKGNKRLKLDDILKTIINIIACFNLKQNVPALSVYSFYEKYKEAINKFYASRYRPSNKTVLAPTLGYLSKNENDLRNFAPHMLTLLQ